MQTKPTLESTLSFAASLDHSEWRDAIISHLEKLELNSALVVCGEAVLSSLRRETDLSIAELKTRMAECRKLEKLEKMISSLARDHREAKRAMRAAAHEAWQQRPHL